MQRRYKKLNTTLDDRNYLSHLEKLQIIQVIRNLMFQAIFIFFDWILIKQISVFSATFCSWGNRIFKNSDCSFEWETGPCIKLSCEVSTESWESWVSWKIEQAVWESHEIFLFFEKSWEIHRIFICCILENSIWFLLNTLLEVFVAEFIRLTLFTYKH